MSINIQTSTGLLEISAKVTKDKIISALGYEPANETHVEDTTVHITSEEREFWNNKDYNLLENTPNITDDESNNLIITDPNNNAIMRVDSDGITTTNVNTKTVTLDGEDLGSRLDSIESISLPNIIDDETGNLTVEDENGNIIVKIDDNGLETTTVTAKSAVIGGEDIVSKIDEHIGDSVAHVTSGERTKWNNKSDFSGDYYDLENRPNIDEDNSGEFTIQDENGNIGFKVNNEGTFASTLNANIIEINIGGDEVLDVQTAIETNANAIELLTNGVSADEVDGVNDLIQYVKEHGSEVTEMQKNISDLQGDSHTHNNKELLDTYKQTEANLSDAVNKKHDHDNKDLLDNLVDDENANSVIILDKENNKLAEFDADGLAVTAIKVGTKNVIDVQEAISANRTDIDVNADAIAVLNGTGAGSVAKQVADAKAQAISTAASDATTKANTAESNAKSHATSLNTAMDTRVKAMESKVPTWDAAEGNAKSYTDGKISAEVTARNNAISALKTELQEDIAQIQDNISLTPNRAVVSDANGKLAVSAVTNTELGYLSGTTANVQEQLDAKSQVQIFIWGADD